MKERDALEIDTDFYADWDPDTNSYCSSGNNSGFAYGSFASIRQAEDHVKDLREDKLNSKKEEEPYSPPSFLPPS
jgi:hypothetical protein